jgi:hypothetical protein
MRAVIGVLASALALASTGALAQSRTIYDWQSGNTYTVRPRLNGGVHVDGYNLNNDSMWNTDIDRRGNMRGYDADSNPWSYDSGSKTYMNYGTGRMCIGEGYARSCF